MSIGVIIIAIIAAFLAFKFIAGMVKFVVLAAIGTFIYKRYGAQARAKYDAWRNEGTPKQPAEAVQYLIENKPAMATAA